MGPPLGDHALEERYEQIELPLASNERRARAGKTARGGLRTSGEEQERMHWCLFPA